MSVTGLLSRKHQHLEFNIMSDKYDELMKLANQVSRSTVAVVDAVTQRGGFKGEELSTIGQLRDQAIQTISIVENLQQDAAMETEE